MNLGEQLSNMSVKVSSPDGHIVGTLKGGDLSCIYFKNNSYIDRYTTDDLSRQLEHVLTLIIVGYQRGRREALEKRGFEVQFGQDHWDSRYRRFYAAAAEMDGEGISNNEWVKVYTIGLYRFSVVLDPDILEELDESQFIDEFVSAVNDLVVDWRMAMTDLRSELLYGES